MNTCDILTVEEKNTAGFRISAEFQTGFFRIQTGGVFMKLCRKFLTESFVRSASRFMHFVCCFVMLVMVSCMVMSFMGHLSFYLSAGGGETVQTTYSIISSDPSESPFGLNVSISGDSIHVYSSDDVPDLLTHLGLSLIYAVWMIPLLLSIWFLSRVFANVSAGKIFVEQNALCLLYYGLLQFFEALPVPLLKLLICEIINRFSEDSVGISTGASSLSFLTSGTAFLIAAYIIHHGIHLQDEVDHTL